MRKGFTLLELLLVVGVIGLALVVLASPLSDVKESATSAVCKTHLRQLALHAVSYAQNHGHFPWGMIDPANHDAEYFPPDMVYQLFPKEDPRFVGAERWSEFQSYCWDFTKKNQDSNWKPGPMFGTVNNTSVLHCPKIPFSSTDNWEGDNYTGYNYNVCYLGYVENDAGNRLYPTAYSKLKYPERVVIFGDGGYSGGPNKFMRATKQDMAYDGSSSSLRKAGTQAFRHGYGSKRHCNMAFADGHVEEFRRPFKSNGSEGWQDEESHSAFISANNNIYGPAGWSDEYKAIDEK